MAEEQSAEKTEEPTQRKLTQARERGELPRSPDFGGAIVVLAICVLMFLLGGQMLEGLSSLLSSGLTFTRAEFESPQDLPTLFGERLAEGLWAVRWVLLCTLVVALLAATMNGGINFSGKAAAPKFSKLNPLSGLTRMFGAQAWIGLLRNLVKFVAVAVVLGWVLWSRRDEMLAMSRVFFEPMVAAGTELALITFTLVSVVVAVIAMLDVPYQRWSYLRRMRMTLQEVRDEMKDIEGRPEIKQQIRKRQRELSRGRMLDKVRDADVVIVNPSEFAVALEYDESRSSVPMVLAKGRGEVAAAIKERAKNAGVPLVSAPPLARAIYFTTEIDQPIPEGLYRAVAAILAYVFRLSALDSSLETPEIPKPQLPDDFLFDENGDLMKGGIQ
ncbi:MAG: flagellar biosynthesis protein FlhB [Xanthomonadales bacterium]|nr:flagellar biosynthesis protein FlhB [Xanthomonadales bacterium]